MKESISILILFFLLSASLGLAETAQELRVRRENLLKQVESFNNKGFNPNSKPEYSDLLYRDQRFIEDFSKYLKQNQLGKDEAERQTLAKKFLRSPDPATTFVAYQDLVRWAKAKGSESLNEEVQMEMAIVPLSTTSHPIEYSLIFQHTYDFAVDTKKGKGLKENAALKFAVDNFRDPKIFSKLEEELKDSLVKAASGSKMLPNMSEAQKRLFETRAVLGNQASSWKDSLAKRESELSQVHSPSSLEAHALSQRKIKAAGVAAVKTLAHLAKEEAQKSLAGFLEFIDLQESMFGKNLFIANYEAETLFSSPEAGPVKERYRNYREILQYAMDKEYGLGLSDEHAHRFALEVAKGGFAKERFADFQKSLINNLLKAKDQEMIPELVNQAAEQARLPRQLLEGLPLENVQNRWTGKIPAKAPKAEVNQEEKEPEVLVPPEIPHRPLPEDPMVNQKRVAGIVAVSATVGAAALAARSFLKKRNCNNSFQAIGDKKGHQQTRQQLDEGKLEDIVIELSPRSKPKPLPVAAPKTILDDPRLFDDLGDSRPVPDIFR